LEVGPDCRLKWAITLVRLLCDGSRVGYAGVENDAMEAEECKEVGIQAARAAITFDNTHRPLMGAASGNNFIMDFFRYWKNSSSSIPPL
jgi:hypothetical protein